MAQADLLSRVKRWALLTLAAGVALFAAYTWLVLHWSYSGGERAGYVQKLSMKGWLCKTWEGEMALISMPGTVAEKFYFTVKDEAVAARINETVGRRVALQYEQHVGIPSSCFGDTEYYIVGTKLVDESTMAPAAIAPAAAPQPVPSATAAPPAPAY